MVPQHNARRRRGLVAAHKACATTIEFWGCSLWEELSCRITEHFHLQLKYSPRKMRILWWKVSLLSSHSSHLPFLFSSLLCCSSALRSTRTVTLPSLKNGNEDWIKKKESKGRDRRNGRAVSLSSPCLSQLVFARDKLSRMCLCSHVDMKYTPQWPCHSSPHCRSLCVRVYVPHLQRLGSITVCLYPALLEGHPQFARSCSPGIMPLVWKH